jgi:protein regulator of cytokinesis 1
LLSKAQEWVDLKAKEEELEAKRNGPDRFNTRGGALLQEEKMRKRLGILKPKVSLRLPATTEYPTAHDIFDR